MKCLYPPCKRPAEQLGLCHACLLTAKRLIARGDTTQESLVRRGRMLQPNRNYGERYRKDPARVAWFLGEAE